MFFMVKNKNPVAYNITKKKLFYYYINIIERIEKNREKKGMQVNRRCTIYLLKRIINNFMISARVKIIICI